MPKKKVEVYDKKQLIYPFIENDHVTFSNGMKVSEMLDQGISMPTITHNETSFKVGVGDSDVSSSIVDSSVSKMVIKGQTYQNILPEPSTHVLTNNKEMFKVNEELDANVEVVDGVAKSAILSGNTLVNTYKITESTPYTYTNGSFPASKLSTNLSANKTYLILLDFSTVDKDGKSIINFFPMSTFIDGTKKQESNFNINKNGRFTYKYTPSKDVTDYAVIIGQNNFEGYNPVVVIENAMIIEYQDGMENWDIPYFEGMQSVKMPVLHSVGKNLYNPDTARVVGINNQDVSNEIDVKPNTTYTFYANGYGWTQVKLYNNTGQMTRHLGQSSASTKVSFTTTNDEVQARLVFLYGNDTVIENVDFTGIQLEEGSAATPYEPYKSNTLSTPEDLELRGIGKVKDGLNLLTGELTQRIGEVVFDGSEDENWHIDMSSNNVTRLNMTFKVGLDNIIDFDRKTTGILCDKFTQISGSSLWTDDVQGIGSSHGNGIKIGIPKSNLITQDVNGFKTWLSQNPVTVQYQLATESIKTVDLSSSGNWEKIVLDGSETGWKYSYSEWANKVFYLSASYTPNLISHGASSVDVICEDIPATHIGWLCQVKGRTGISAHNYDGYTLQIAIDGIETIEALKQYLSQNPLTVWYQTRTHLDSTQVKQPIFFKDGHINQSSRTDNSLIPTLDYQAKTSNSYVMDLMKTNTRYTMKAKSASGTFTIDGTSYGAETNGTFTTPTSMTNKLLVMSNKTNEEVMILEGDIVSKSIPYFKGIKSAFEDEDKIEVLSHGKNLFDIEKVARALHSMGNRETIKIENGYKIKALDHGTHNRTKLQLKPNTTYIASFTLAKDPSERLLNFEIYTTVGSSSSAFYVVEEGSFVRTFTTDKTGVIEVRMDGGGNGYTYYTNIQIEESPNVTSYEPYKSNSTKIPLLSPLRSLPEDGVRDEIILDRENNKAKIIQRVGRVVLDGKENWSTNSSFDTTETKFFYLPNSRIPNTWGRIFSGWRHITSNRFVSNTDRTSAVNQKIEWISGGDGANGMIQILIKKERLSTPDVSGFKKWLSQNPTTVYYELETPVVTEVDLEGFPYIYKDGHIFLNSEIVPTTEITYSINQGQQISASNEDIIRHEKELTYLQKLIAQYVQVNYESVLLSLKI